MPYNGAGVYSPPGADFPAVTQTVISSTHYNNVVNDIATALSLALTRDGQATVTGNIPFGGFRATNIGITGIAGSVGTPAINVSDAGTGLYRSAASELAVTVAGTQRGRFDATGLIVTGTVNASTSVVTSLAGTVTDVPFDVQVNSLTKWRFLASVDSYGLFPGTDNSQNFGDPTKRIARVFTPIIDSGTTGSLSLKTNNGVTQFQIDHTTSAVNNVAVTGSATGSGTASIYVSGTDANINVQYGAKASGSHNFYTSWGAAVQQFQILHTASASRNITVTGSNGGNPTIGVTAGSLAITPAVVIAGASLQVGTNPSSSGVIGIPFGAIIASRNSANSGDVSLLQLNIVNTVNDIVVLGSGSGGVVGIARSGGAAPTTSDLAAGRWAVWRDTGGATTKLYYNNGGVIQSVALA